MVGKGDVQLTRLSVAFATEAGPEVEITEITNPTNYRRDGMTGR